MTRFAFKLSALVLWLVVAQPALRAETTNEAPDFREVYDLVRAHLSGVNDAELNRAAVQGLVTALGPKVSLVSGTNDSIAASRIGPLIISSNLFDGEIAYVRIGRVADGLAKDLDGGFQQLNSSNKLKGIVLDLRYAEGSDYAAAAAVADLFVSKAQPLLNWGKGVVSSQEKANAIRLPVAVLVNSVTSGSAEALAALLRETGVALVLGGRTAGQAMVGQTFPLKNGQQLRIATAPVVLGNGKSLPEQGVRPDIDVAVTPENERAYFADAFLVLPKAGPVTSTAMTMTNQASGTNSHRVRFNEAELVREHREGLNRDEGEAREVPSGREIEPDKPVVSDPVLARALDLLKGLAVVRQAKP